MRTVYVNGQYVAEDQATVSIFDRGFLMGDAVYEVTAVLDGKLLDFDAHTRRLARSLGEVGIKAPADDATLLDIHRQLIERNQLQEGRIYMQISRGIAERDFAYSDDMQASLVLFTQSASLVHSPVAERGMRVITVEDIRWKRRDIKTTQLLAPSLGKMQARNAGADDAWMVEDSLVTEGTSNNAWIVRDGQLITRQISRDILAGVTRAALARCAATAQLHVIERAFSVEEAQDAQEAFITSSTTVLYPVISIDGVNVGDGTVGPIAKQLRLSLLDAMRASAL